MDGTPDFSRSTAATASPAASASYSGAATAEAAKPLLQVENLQIRFATDTDVIQAVEGLELSVGAGEIVALVGESGSGKSVFAHSIMRLLSAQREGR